MAELIFVIYFQAEIKGFSFFVTALFAMLHWDFFLTPAPWLLRIEINLNGCFSK